MDFFIQKIFEDKPDELVHMQFKKFGMGRFGDRALVLAKNSGGKYSVGTSYEYANELVRCVVQKLGDGKVKVSGVVVSTKELEGLNYEGKKQFMGIKQYQINREMSKEELNKLLDTFPTAFTALSFKTGDTDLKIKPKAPKSGKPSTKGKDKPKPDFCKLKTFDKEIIKSLLFDIDLDNFKLANVDHVFIIDNLEVDYSIEDPNEMREKAKRIGKILRTIDVDGDISKAEKRFVA